MFPPRPLPVTKEKISTAFPLPKSESVNPAIHADELVVFDGAQILPLFVLYLN